MAKKLTNFLIALSADTKTRDKYRDPAKRAKLLQQWDLTNEPALQPGATAEDVRAAVVAETGLDQVEFWISVDGTPVPNPDYDDGA
jgi:hypothetical protein